jgi:carbamoyltransferase
MLHPKEKKTYYIGFNSSYHDSALAVVNDQGEIVFAEACERGLQYKRALNCEPDNLSAVPRWLDKYCPDAEHLVVTNNWRASRPWYERIASVTGLLGRDGVAHRGFKRLRSPLSTQQIHHMMACNRLSLKRAGLNLASIVGARRPKCTVEFRDFDHHATHAALACYGSGLNESVCAVIDSYGENGSAAFFTCRNGRLTLIREARGLGSLGLFYMKLTELCGFDWMQGEEWKVMGLAAYGQVDEAVLQEFRRLLRVDGLALVHPTDTTFSALDRLEGYRRDKNQSPERSADLACTGQFFFGEIMAQLLGNLHERTGLERLCLAGGCALNSSFTGQITRSTPFREVYVPPAPADDGTAVGAAWLAWTSDHGHQAPLHAPMSPYLGSELDEEGVTRLQRFGLGLQAHVERENLAGTVATLLAQGKLVAWVQGRAEFGPRALGNRSILADPRSPATKDRINVRVKFREEFRPFAPSILHEHGHEYFENYQSTPYMERALRFRPEAMARVPAVVHRDGTGRLQSVSAGSNPHFYRLLKAFQNLTGVPVLLNTSFNVMGKPMVHSVEDAVAVFMTSGLDALVIGDRLFIKPESA